jgi:hypothetical protein
MTPYRPRISSQADLQAAWRHLMDPFCHSHRAVWWLFLDPAGRPVPQLSELEDAGEVPDPELREVFGGFLLRLAEELAVPPGARIAFLVARPGPDVVRPEDRAWAAALYDVGRRAGLGCEVVHLGTDAGVVPLPLDEIDLAG